MRSGLFVYLHCIQLSYIINIKYGMSCHVPNFLNIPQPLVDVIIINRFFISKFELRNGTEQREETVWGLSTLQIVYKSTKN